MRVASRMRPEGRGKARSGQNIYAASASQAHVQAAIDAANSGDHVIIPADDATWTTGVTCGKAITIQGAGSGRVEGSSTTSIAIETGSKTFTILSGSVVSDGFVVGETIRAVYKAAGTNYMEGTVTAWDGTTLVIDVATTGGTGTKSAWTFVAPASTTITHNVAGVLFSVTEQTTGSVELCNLCIRHQSTGTTYHAIEVTAVSGGYPVLVHDVRRTGAVTGSFIYLHQSRVVIWRLYADAGFDFSTVKDTYLCRVKNTDPNNNGWNAINTMGTDDDGTHNAYLEQSYFVGCGLVTDWDDNARGVVRYCVLDNSSCASHGVDSSHMGMMHAEYYNNVCIFNDISSDTLNLQNFIEARGGTGVVAHNVIPDISSGMWGSKSEISMQCQTLQRSGGLIGGWSSGDGGTPEYPYPRQVGMGHANAGYTSHDVTSQGGYAGINLSTGLDNNSTPTYLGDLCPWHQWGNTGSGNYTSVSGQNYESPGSTYDDAADYFQTDRDWLNTTKPNYTKYTYPHPRRTGA